MSIYALQSVRERAMFAALLRAYKNVPYTSTATQIMSHSLTQGGNFNVSPLYSWSGATRLGGNLLFVTYFKAQPCKDVFLQAPNDRNRNLKTSKVPLESQM